MSATSTLNEDILRQARAVGGEFNEDFDRQVAPGQDVPFYTVVGKNSKDSSYRGELNGKSVEISRAGELRRKGADGSSSYHSELPEVVVLDARTSYTIFKENRVVARGISTKGLQNAVWTHSEGCVIVGASCENSPYCRWTWERLGGKEGRVTDGDGNVLSREDLATCSLQLWCWDLRNDEHCIVQFSAGAIKAYREWARDLEADSVKVHSVLWALSSTPVDNGATAAPSYVPRLEAVRALTEEEFVKADMERAVLVVKQSALATPLAKAPTSLPAASVFSNPPLINKGPAVRDPSDVFAGDA